jgi:3-methyladenine DNA glycosylase AlkD
VRSAADIVDQLRSLANAANVEGMARYGISPVGTLGVGIPVLRGIAKELRPYRTCDPQALHVLASQLWATGLHEVRILAALVDVPALVTREQADSWVADMDSWDVVDMASGLWAATPFGYAKAEEWAGREEEFVKRSGFVLMCALAVHDKKASDEPFLHFLTLVEREAGDGRNLVKKAVNWALRQIGKRNGVLNAAAVATAERLRESGSKAARWVASDARRELTSDAVRVRLDRRHGRGRAAPPPP